MVEGDCSNLIQQLRQRSLSLSMAGGVIEGAKTLAESFNSFTFNFVLRCNNKLAHLLSKLPELDVGGSSILPIVNHDVI